MTKAPKELLSLNTFSPDPLSGPYWPHSADAWSCGVADALQQLRHIFSRSQQRGSAVAAADDLLLNAVKTTPLSLSLSHTLKSLQPASCKAWHESKQVTDNSCKEDIHTQRTKELRQGQSRRAQSFNNTLRNFMHSRTGNEPYPTP